MYVSQSHTFILILALIGCQIGEMEANSMAHGGTPSSHTFERASGKNSPKLIPKFASLKCSFHNLHTLIGHKDFSILGMFHNCAVFYAVGDNIKPDSDLNFSKIQNLPGRCSSPQPILYRQNNEFRLLIAQKMSAYTGKCKWNQESENYQTCKFDRKHWKRLSVKPFSSDESEIIGYTSDVNTNILHVFFNDENGLVHDSMYNISSEKFIKNAVLQQRNLKKISYDSDRGLMYMLTKEIIYQRVKNDLGVFIYQPTYTKTLGDGRVAYYAGAENVSEQYCIVELSSEDELYMTLFVGSGGRRSVHELIRSQLAPQPVLTRTILINSTPMSKAAAKPLNQALILLLFTLLLFR
ncbi:unnamed protein product [Thelazia callipaeda]|uniref:Sema domain-containing protein n=1 Tax=Thelazia callipaeda TaxID=103827 RepID=A0A0N5CMC8_THECL|nr:unnamed protein product [Thelazia callipaeda]